MKKKKEKKAKKKIEWSKKFCALIALGFGGYGVWCGIEYYRLSQIAIENGTQLPDATLAVTCVSVVIASLVSYLLYQAGLKNSRNKYGIDADGQPFKLTVVDEEEQKELNKPVDESEQFIEEDLKEG